MHKVIVGIAAVLVIIVIVCFLLFGKGLFGFGGGDESGTGTGSAEKAAASATAPVTDTAEASEIPDSTSDAIESVATIIEIRIQGREYNFQNITYGNEKHSLEELLNALNDFPRDTRIDLIIEDNATKNAVDELESSLITAGFTDIRK